MTQKKESLSVYAKTDSSFASPDISLEVERTDTVKNKISILQIHYPNDGFCITAADKENIRRYLSFFDSTSIKKINVIGYTDSLGSTVHNQELSLNRAITIRAYILYLGYPSDKITILGLAEKNPISSNSKSEGRKQNRRTEVFIED